MERTEKLLFFAFLAVLLLFPATRAEAPADRATVRRVPFQRIRLREREPGGIMALPFELLVIEDSAFEGTAFSAAVLPETVRFIGNRAFAHMPDLRLLNIPDSLAVMGRDVFLGSEAITLLGSPGGMARIYAEAHQIPFRTLEEALPAPQRDPLPKRAADGFLPVLLMAILISCAPRLRAGSVAPWKPLRWRKRAELHPLNLCFP